MGTEIVCLALSRRTGGHCLAGFDCGENRWVRPVRGQPRPELHLPLPPNLLDIIDLPASGPAPEAHQPENWLVGEGRIRVVGRISEESAQPLLNRLTTLGPEILGNATDCIRHAEVLTTPLPASITIIQPSELSFHVKPGFYENQEQARCTFTLDDWRYDLAVTDCAFERRMFKTFQVGSGRHLPAELGISTAATIYLTVSLTGVLGGFHYKLVAGVIPIPGLEPQA
jgi:hypothetical protein